MLNIEILWLKGFSPEQNWKYYIFIIIITYELITLIKWIVSACLYLWSFSRSYYVYNFLFHILGSET